MAHLVIRDSSGINEVIELVGPEVSIGRNPAAGVVLANVSVSRKHAMLTEGGKGWTVIDLDSQNGVSVNGQRVGARELEDGDHIKIGKFDLVFVLSKAGAVDGESVDGMLNYRAPAGQQSPHSKADATFALDAETLKEIRTTERTLNKAHLIATDGEKWLIGDAPLVLGGSGAVAINGPKFLGELATIQWGDSKHTITRRGFWVPLQVNGNRVKMHHLRLGDRVSIGNAEFVYQLESPKPQ
jgi:predicted component of type VI protein secretion system